MIQSKKKNKIPQISPDRIDNSGELKNSIGYTKEDQNVKSFLKGKKPIQAITLRFPKDIYKNLRKIAFEEETKINKIVVQLVEEYVNSKECR